MPASTKIRYQIIKGYGYFCPVTVVDYLALIVTLLRQELTQHFINSMIQKTNEVKIQEAQGPLCSFE